MDGWTSVRLDELDPISVAGVHWRPLRRTLGVQAFGLNAYVAPRAGDHVVEEHTESTLQHEEVYVVLTGHATFEVGSETLDAPAGTVVFVRDPELRRHAVAAEDDTTVLAIGGKDGEAYTPSAWEAYFHAERHRATGDFAAMAAELSEALVEYPDNASVLYNLGCAEAQAGRHDEAVAHIQRALELRPAFREWAVKDSDLDSIRERLDLDGPGG
jgi:tetratricopeptide (TPR) repeat protein